LDFANLKIKSVCIYEKTAGDFKHTAVMLLVLLWRGHRFNAGEEVTTALRSEPGVNAFNAI
jgi:hypothetical protein